MGQNFVKGRRKNVFWVSGGPLPETRRNFFADERSGRLCVSLFFAHCGGATV